MSRAERKFLLFPLDFSVVDGAIKLISNRLVGEAFKFVCMENSHKFVIYRQQSENDILGVYPE